MATKPAKGRPRRQPTPPHASLSTSGWSPELATLVSDAPTGEGWIHEIKFDGHRMLAHLQGGRARLVSRGGIDRASRFPTLARAVEALPTESAVLDGEVVSVRADGRTSFQDLQASLTGANSASLRYYVFDLLALDGEDLRDLPLLERKARLEKLLGKARGLVIYSRHVRGRGAEFHAAACLKGLEGIVSKRADAPYRMRRTTDWCKVRCGSRQEMVIGGYTEHSRDPRAFGALLLGYHDDSGRLRYAGRVGTGFSERDRRDLRRRLERLERRTSPFLPGAEEGEDVHWVRPTLVGEVKFTEWTAEGRLRHPIFVGLRDDKPAANVVRERVGPGTPRRRKQSVHQSSRKPLSTRRTS